MMAMLGAREHKVWEDHASLGRTTPPIKALVSYSAEAESSTFGNFQHSVVAQNLRLADLSGTVLPVCLGFAVKRLCCSDLPRARLLQEAASQLSHRKLKCPWTVMSGCSCSCTLRIRLCCNMIGYHNHNVGSEMPMVFEEMFVPQLQPCRGS